MQLRRNRLTWAVIFLLGNLAAVSQVAGTPGTPNVWGGPHVSIVTSEKNVTLEFDCAQGIILNPIQPDAHGNFVAEGTYTPQRGGPVKKDSPPNDLPATYKGSIHGNTMHLQVVLANQEQQPPALTLIRGEAGHIVKCR